jgi:hypothetical protein
VASAVAVAVVVSTVAAGASIEAGSGVWAKPREAAIRTTNVSSMYFCITLILSLLAFAV